MKGNQIDDLFRKKLSHQKLTPPPAAWSAIEQNLPGKKKKGAYFWIGIAASILVIFTAGLLLIGQGKNPTVIGPETQANAKDATEFEIKAPAQADESAQNLVAKKTNTPEVVKPSLDEPTVKQLVAKNRKPVKTNTPAPFNAPQELSLETLPVARVQVEVAMITIDDRLAPEMGANPIKYEMLMPVDLTAYYIPYTEDLELAPKKKKFRVLNGIISVAKEVNSGKLSFKELRNAKNNFVEGDLKYGTKESDSDSEDDTPESPGKD